MKTRTQIAIISITAVVACGGSPTAPQTNSPTTASPPPAIASSPIAIVDAGAVDAAAPIAATPSLQVTPMPIAGGTGPLSLDYIGQDPGHVWIPFVAASSGAVAVFDTTKGTFAIVPGFKTVEREGHGQKRAMGPSSVSAGDGVVYVGNRGTAEICVIDATKLSVGKCLKLSSSPDGVAYVAAAHEVWVTTPADHSLTVLDASKKDTLKVKTTIKVDGDPEGYAVDAENGLFFTNLEDKNRTLEIDVKTHRIVATWSPSCGADGPRGIAVDGHRKLVIVACTDHLQVLDAGHDGAPLGQLDTGAGVDNIDLVGSLVYAAAGKSARMTIARVDDHGALSVVASGTTSDGARNAVADKDGKAYVVDGKNALLLVVQPSH